ncbi:hypothetical protein JOD97_001675 [Duganella sp. 1411]|uniref:hypothetical protein n=1 Tax=Duganella sp. 1411 TaxID=2806572 RepID=UPI001AE5E624|nr:hypothetical protein [Duganella sp. 1411]MBP1203661.1 hypothetical protein [Duganella sp. 1411]
MLNIGDFKENLVGYDCYRLLNTNTIWMNEAEADNIEKVLNSSLSPESFANFFSYVPQKNRCFDAASLDLRDHRVYEAERYGGGGVGDNGGGGRVGNYANFQVKGAGPNPVTNSSTTWYSYGSLNLVDAAYEAIFSTILNDLLPLGCAKIYGIIFTSKTGAFHSVNGAAQDAQLTPASGALLVREPTLRPAHFMRADVFTPAKSSNLMRDSNRVRIVNKRLREKFAGDNDFIRYLGKFLLSSAKQMSFALAARITHGALTASNMCLDGRWIDLTEARFLSGGKNFTGLNAFYDDPKIPAYVLSELAYIFGKSNVVNFNLAPLMAYYQRVFDSCFAYYGLGILGLPSAELTEIAEGDDGKLVARAFFSVITRHKKSLSDVDDVPDPEDPVIDFMRSLYRSLPNDGAGASALEAALSPSDLDAGAVAAAFERVFLKSIAASDGNGAAATRSKRIACAIKALRWAYLSSFFYKKRLISHLYYLSHQEAPARVGEFIAECIGYAKWIFSTATSGSVPLLETAAVRVSFEESQHIYVVAADERREFSRYADCLEFMANRYPGASMSGNFDPSFYLNGIHQVLTGLESDA